MYTFQKLIIIFTATFIFAHAHLLPEDSVSDDAEQLNREKRDDFINSILKTIPFFNVAPSEAMLQDDDETNDVEDEEFQLLKPSSSFMSISKTSTLKPSFKATPSVALSSSFALTATTFTINSTNSVQISKTPELTSTSSVLNVISSIPSPYYSASLLSLISIQTTTSLASRSVLITRTSRSWKKSSSMPTSSYPTASSVATTMPVSPANISPSSVNIQAMSSYAPEMMEPVIKMMIMSAEGPKLPDETGYGDTIGKTPNEEQTEIKNIRFLYSNILLPVMSGIFGALLITLGIVIYRCLRRRNLKKVRYYGGKSTGGLYRLDQMSLLSDTSSDEEYS